MTATDDLWLAEQRADHAASRRRIVELEAEVADLTSLVREMTAFLPGGGEVRGVEQRRRLAEVRRRAEGVIDSEVEAGVQPAPTPNP